MNFNNAMKVIIHLNNTTTTYAMTFVKSVYTIDKAIEVAVKKVNKTFEDSEYYATKAEVYETWMNSHGCTPTFDERTALKLAEKVVA